MRYTDEIIIVIAPPGENSVAAQLIPTMITTLRDGRALGLDYEQKHESWQSDILDRRPTSQHGKDHDIRPKPSAAQTSCGTETAGNGPPCVHSTLCEQLLAPHLSADTKFSTITTMITTGLMRPTAICLLLLFLSLILGCRDNASPRLNGSYVLDKDATMAFLETSFKDDKEKLAGFDGMLSKRMTIDFHGSRQTIILEGETITRPYRVAETGPNHLIIECEWSDLEAAIIGDDIERQRIEFTADGFWMGSSGIAMKQFRQKYVRKQ